MRVVKIIKLSLEVETTERTSEAEVVSAINTILSLPWRGWSFGPAEVVSTILGECYEDEHAKRP